jgi:putative flippase GtrA
LRIKSLLETNRKEVILYLITGVWNTVFGYGVYAFFVWLLTGKLPAAYMFASVISTFFSVTNSYLSYKVFVFKTKGNYIKEYIKCWAVYGSAGIVNLALLPVAVFCFNTVLPDKYLNLSPYLAGLALLFVTTVFSFLGHKNVTFKKGSKNL